MNRKYISSLIFKFIITIIVKPFYKNGLNFHLSRFYMKILSLINSILFFSTLISGKFKTINNVKCFSLIFKKNQNTVIIYVHGGGFVSGSSLSHLNIIKKLSNNYKQNIVSIDYSLSPEKKFPKSIFEIVSIYKYYSKKFKKIYIGGDSAGSNLVLSSVNYLKSKKLNLPNKIFLFSPNLDLSFSMLNNQVDDFYQSNNSNSSKLYRERINQYYYDKKFNINSKYLSPLFSDFTNYPEVLIQVSDTEVLIDESKYLFQNLLKYKVKADLQIWSNLPHVWHLYSFLPDSKKALEKVNYFLKNNLIKGD